MAGPARIFISYSRSDGQADAGRLSDTLEGRFGPERIFLDVANIDLGDNWARVIDHTLRDAVALLLVIGLEWTPTEAIAHELRLALESGVAVIPILVRGATWNSVKEKLPSALEPIASFQALTIDHGRWRIEMQPLLDLLDRMLQDPARARVIYKPPEPVSVLQTCLNERNMRSLLVHAAELAECLDDPAILAEAQQIASRLGSDSSEERPAPSELLFSLKVARHRLMIEQIGRDVLRYAPAVRAAQFLQDAALEEEVRRTQEAFDEEVGVRSASRGELGDPAWYLPFASQSAEKARNRLRECLPGITKNEAKRKALTKLVDREVTRILNAGRIADEWEYSLLKHYSSYPDMPVWISNRSNVPAMLGWFTASKPYRVE